MNIFILVQYVLLILVCADSIFSQSHYYIIPSPNGLCNQDFDCLTLSQFAATDSSNEANITLFFQHGNHTLDRELFLDHRNNFTIEKDARVNETVYVECAQRVGRFHISNTNIASIKNLHFIGCGGNTITQVEHLFIENATFQGLENSDSALVLNRVIDARIINSSFFFNVLPIGSAYNSRNLVDWLLMQKLEFIRMPFFGRRPTRSIQSGGVIYSAFSNVSITCSKFLHNQAEEGGVLAAKDSSIHISSSYFGHNNASFGGVINTTQSQVYIYNSTFIENSAQTSGGIMITHKSLCIIKSSNFTKNQAFMGGALITMVSTFDISDSTFTDNMALSPYGEVSEYEVIAGVVLIISSHFSIRNTTLNGISGFTHSFIVTHEDSSVHISDSFVIDHHGHHGGVILAYDDALITIANGTFTDNSARSGGVMEINHKSSINITNSIFTDNHAFLGGGVITIFSESSLNIYGSTFSNNVATYGYGGVIQTYSSSPVNIAQSMFTNNSAVEAGGVIRCFEGSINVENSIFNHNSANKYGGIMILSECPTNISNSKFDQNERSLYIFNSKLIFSGYTNFENSIKPRASAPLFETPISDPISSDNRQFQEGGAITIFRSDVTFTGVTIFFNNQASDGGAILATESTIILSGTTTITDNMATTSNGGGMHLRRTVLEISGDCKISQNLAMRGGGIHAIGSTISVHPPGTLQLLNNSAVNGSGIYLQANTKLYTLKESTNTTGNFLNFIHNHAQYGGAVYIDDDSNIGACLPDNECFFQTLALYQALTPTSTANIHFSNNSATMHGSDIFGGLLDRCVPSTFAEVYLSDNTYLSGSNYLAKVSNMQPHKSSTVTSHPVRVCFCTDKGQLDCSYQPPKFTVKKGETITVSLTAVDHVYKPVGANIISSLSSSEGGLGEGQQTQQVESHCTDVVYNVFSPHDSETINLFADGPCGSATLSTRNVSIEFIECTCPVGFEPVSNSPNATRCDCDCDSGLHPYITNCNATTSTVQRINTNSWIAYITDTDQPGYVIHPTCPFDYCYPLTESISINFNHSNAADQQCAYNHIGVLCGACQHNLSLSLGSSRCIPCHSHWPAVFVVIFVAAIVAGILLVIALLTLNMTVTVGLVNGFIFYANIVSAGNAVFFPSSEPSFPTIFVAWLNFDIGVDVCFIDGLDVYTKTWLQLVFPVYIIILVAMVIVGSDYSDRFAVMIGKKDPVATLATLILLSYAKLLSITITALSFTVLQYPDGSQDFVWLADGNVKYFKGKHIPLALAALSIVLIGVPYTILLLFWQWIVRAPRLKILAWTRNSKLNTFIDTHHVPYSRRCRYWTGLLLLVRVILYITASVTVSSTPQTLPLVTGILIGAIFLLKGAIGLRVYTNSLIDIVHTVLYFNLLAFTTLSQYNFKTDIIKQTAVAYVSTIATFVLLIWAIVYHLYLLIKREKSTDDLSKDKYLDVPIKDEITHTIIEFPKTDQIPQPDTGDDQEITAETIIKNGGIDTPPPQ